MKRMSLATNAASQARSSCTSSCSSGVSSPCGGAWPFLNSCPARAIAGTAASPTSTHTAIQARTRCMSSPVRRHVVFEKGAPTVDAGVEPVDDRIDDARGPVDDVERRVEAMVLRFPLRDLERVLVGHPARVHAVHVDAVGVVVGG